MPCRVARHAGPGAQDLEIVLYLLFQLLVPAALAVRARMAHGLGAAPVEGTGFAAYRQAFAIHGFAYGIKSWCFDSLGIRADFQVLGLITAEESSARPLPICGIRTHDPLSPNSHPW